MAIALPRLDDDLDVSERDNAWYVEFALNRLAMQEELERSVSDYERLKAEFEAAEARVRNLEHTLLSVGPVNEVHQGQAIMVIEAHSKYIISSPTNDRRAKVSPFYNSYHVTVDFQATREFDNVEEALHTAKEWVALGVEINL